MTGMLHFMMLKGGEMLGWACGRVDQGDAWWFVELGSEWVVYRDVESWTFF